MTRLVAASIKPDVELAAAIDVLRRYLDEGRTLGSGVHGLGAISALEDAADVYLGHGRQTLAVGSATAALLTAMNVVGVKPGDEVVTSAYDWGAATAAIRAAGATPVHADVFLGSGLIDPAAVADAVSTRTVAIIATHLFGLPADVPALRSIADRHGLVLVEDCAQAIGAAINGRAVGTWGDLAAFSFGPGKTVDAGEGGLLVAATDDLHRAAVSASQHPARQALGGCDPINPLAMTSRMHPLAAVLAFDGIQHVEERVQQQRRAAELLWESIRASGTEIERLDLVAAAAPSWSTVDVVPTEPPRTSHCVRWSKSSGRSLNPGASWSVERDRLASRPSRG